MAKRDPRVDAYIENSADFARPILQYIRDVVHAAVPNVEETMKWSFPHFDYKGMMCSMAAFQQHCAFGFWKAPLVLGDLGNRDAMGHFGRLTSVKDLPPKKEFVQLVKKAAALNDEGVKISRPKRAPRGDAQTPDDLAAALKKDKKARSAFEKFPASHRRLSTSNGSPRRRRKRRGSGGSARLSNGCRKESRETGNT